MLCLGGRGEDFICFSWSTSQEKWNGKTEEALALQGEPYQAKASCQKEKPGKVRWSNQKNSPGCAVAALFAQSHCPELAGVRLPRASSVSGQEQPCCPTVSLLLRTLTHLVHLGAL